MAVEEINAAGGIAEKYKIDLQIRDAGVGVALADAAAGELIAGGARALIAPYGR